MIEILLGMAGLIVILIILSAFLYSQLSHTKKQLKNANDTIKAVGKARQAINIQKQKEQDDEEINDESIVDRTYFSD